MPVLRRLFWKWRDVCVQARGDYRVYPAAAWLTVLHAEAYRIFVFGKFRSNGLGGFSPAHKLRKRSLARRMPAE